MVAFGIRYSGKIYLKNQEILALQSNNIDKLAMQLEVNVCSHPSSEAIIIDNYTRNVIERFPKTFQLL